ncbi:MAG: hypothetical protein ACP5TV_11135 [Anaerolineae bacterium]
MLAKPRWGLTVIFLLAGIRAALFGLLAVPPWQAPDEPGHYEYARLLADFGLREPPAPARGSLQRDITASLAETRFWEGLGKPVPNPLPARFSQDPYLISQREDEPVLYYLLPALLLRRLPADPILGLRLMRLWSVLLYALTMGCIWLGLGELTPNVHLRRLAMATALLIPMPAFIGSSANNDTAGMLIATAALWWLLRTIRRGWDLRRAGLMALFLLAAAFTKKTTLFLWPAVLLTLLIVYRKELRAWLAARRAWWPAVGLAFASALSIAWSWHLAGAADWVHPDGYRPAERSSAAVHAGQYALYLAPAVDGEPTRALQELSFNTAQQLRGSELCLGAWVGAQDAPAQGYLVITDGESSTRRGFRLERAGWQYVEACRLISDRASRLAVVIANAGPTPLLADDITLRRAGGPTHRQLLQNPGLEEGAHWSQGWWARFLRVSPGQVPHLLEPASYSWPSLRRCILFAVLTFAGFWANFGWLTLPLAPQWYLLPAGVCLAAGAGLLRALRRRGFAAKDAVWAGIGTAAGLILLQTFLPMIGSGWQPQGRYLFPALLPFCALLAAGWLELAPARLPRAVWSGVLVLLLLIFDQIAFWGYLVPHYHHIGLML